MNMIGTTLDIYGQTHDPLTVQYVLDKQTAVTTSTNQSNGALTVGVSLLADFDRKSSGI